MNVDHQNSLNQCIKYQFKPSRHQFKPTNVLNVLNVLMKYVEF